MTLEQILGHVDRYVNRTDPDYVTNRIAFVQAGHRWIERKFHGKEALFGRWDSAERVEAHVGVVPLPACYRASAELRVRRLPDRAPLRRIPPRAIRSEVQLDDGIVLDLRDTSQYDLPLYFAVAGRALEIRPLPAVALDLEIEGTGWAEPLTNPLDETVLSQEAPDAVIYAACREVWLFMGDEPQMMYWQAQAGQAVAEWIADRVAEEEPPTLVMETPG